MRILVSDYSGHPFQVQLSRTLAARGYNLRHVSSASFQTPKGRLNRSQGDPASFSSVTVRSRAVFAKDRFLKRRKQEIEIGQRIAEQIEEFRPDIVISSNAPLDTQLRIQRAAKKTGARFIFWVQDLYGEAIYRILRQKLGTVGSLIGSAYQRLEARLLRSSDHVVVIAPEFASAVSAMTGIENSRISVVENWAPLDELRQSVRENAWAVANLPESPFRAIYSGTLGFKHNPQLLLALARGIKGDVIVMSEGPAADKLKQDAAEKGIANLHVAGWLPFDVLPEALAGADLLIVILEADAGAFSVPSKVLTYMCVGRPILGAIPASNLAARIIQQSGAGKIVDPDDELAFVAAAARMAADAADRDARGVAARTYAERTFDINAIADKFEHIISVQRSRQMAHELEHEREMQNV